VDLYYIHESDTYVSNFHSMVELVLGDHGARSKGAEEGVGYDVPPAAPRGRCPDALSHWYQRIQVGVRWS
jgi:hypothetical protein